MKKSWEPLWDDARQRSLAYKAVFTGVTGELVLEDMKRTLGLLRPSFDRKNPDPNVTAFNEGQRAVVAAIINTIELADLPPAPPEDTDQDAE